MRKLVSALAAACALASIGLGPTSAHAQESPFCILGDGYPPRGDCSFETYEQCLATASGRKAWCDRNYFYAYPNPAYAAPAPYLAPHPRAWRKRHRQH